MYNFCWYKIFLIKIVQTFNRRIRFPEIIVIINLFIKSKLYYIIFIKRILRLIIYVAVNMVLIC